MIDISSQQAVERRRGEKLDVFTPVVAAREAGFAGVADDVRLDGYAVAGF